MEKIVLAGGTGFVGRYFKIRFEQLGCKVEIISRQGAHIGWDDRARIAGALEGAALLINLAGKSVNCRYHKRNKREILHSRLETTKILGEAVAGCQTPPELWINASTATIYRHAEDKPMTEEAGEIGAGFSVEVAKAWEQAFFSFSPAATRQVALRIAIVLGKEGGVMTPYRNLVHFGLGGVQGTGKQMFSWIHIEDLFQIILFLKERQELSGVFNCAAPVPVTNREFMQRLRQRHHVPFGLPAPKWLLELGARIIRTETELVLKSRWVIPERLEQEGFSFKFRTIEQALEEL